METATLNNLKSAPPIADDDGLARLFIETFPAMNADDQRLALTLYRRLIEGRAVSATNLATVLNRSAADIRHVLGQWPGIFYDDAGAIVGFWGLTVKETMHRLAVAGNAVYAWCAWDTLFLPELLGAAVDVTSRCPQTGDAVRLRVSPIGIESVELPSAVVSFVQVDERDLREHLTTKFCHFVHFFRDREAGEQWMALHPGTFLLSLAVAFDLGRRVNAARYSDSLSPQGDPS